MTGSDSPIFLTASDDADMEKAATKARQTFRYFWREMYWECRRIIPGLELAAVKGAISDPPEFQTQHQGSLEVEYMWLLDVEFDGRKLEGTLINSPRSLMSITEGDRVTLVGKQVVDWMYMIGGYVYGGFTVDLIRSRMSKGERKQHDQAWGFDFGEVGLVNLVPPEYIGEAPARKKSFLRFSAATPQDYSVVAATEHPMSVNTRDLHDKNLKENPDLLHQADHRGFSFLHQFSLAGSLDGVDVFLRHGADPNKSAFNGMTPLRLAKCLGWKKVMARLQQAGAS